MSFIVRLYHLSQKSRKLIISIWLSYLAGIGVEYISDASDLNDLLFRFIDFSKLSVIILWVGFILIIAACIFSLLFKKLFYSQLPSKQFYSLMNRYTCRTLAEAETSGYAWGYNKNVVTPQNPRGWNSESVFIDLAGSVIDTEYAFPVKDKIMDGYDAAAFDRYYKNDPTIALIRSRGDDMERFAVSHYELNSNKKNKRLEIRLQKTRWSQLQFSWGYLRLLDTRNNPVSHRNLKEIEATYVSALNRSRLLINSFCLHLILVAKNGNAVLSRISNVKSNDYPQTWAATIGEQLEKEDFFDEATGRAKHHFVLNWVKRALKEEFDIDENEYNEFGQSGQSELETYVDMASLRVLSLDFEGDIYNFALTCIIKLKIDASQLLSVKGIRIDRNENTLQIEECSPADARRILLNYPGNIHDYHPSTYLRLLMYHLYTEGTAGTYNALIRAEKNKKFH